MNRAVEIRDTVPADTMGIASDIRELDRRELALFLSKQPYEAIDFIVKNSQSCVTALHKGRPSAIIGYNVTDALFKIVSPFMIATRHAEAHPFLFAKYSPELMRQFNGKFLRNWVVAENDFAIKWLEWLGFDIHEPELFNLTPVRMFTKDMR